MQHTLEKLRAILLYEPGEPLMFNTGLFMVLFLVFLALYHAVKRHQRLKMLTVILFSLYFYYKSSAGYCLILLGVCLSDYVLGRLMGVAVRPAVRRAIVTVNVLANVGMLVYFKYFNLLADTFCSIVGRDFDPISVILPAGISFFTFRSISYIVDLYRRQMEPCRNLLHYIFFLTFFPPLLAGPVVRAKDMLPQIRANANPTSAMTAEGLFLVMCGLVKKVVIADYISGNFVDRIFDNPALYSGFENLMGCVGFTVQLYCDFSGYSDMAIGLALMLGYRFKVNFMAPFKACNPSDFWRRWHISLSTWLRDYVYIPLGGNRRGRTRTYVNNFLTMLIGGLWHGASWMYVIWGAYHGVLLAVHKAIKPWWRLPAGLVGCPVVKFANVALTFTLVVVGFVFFRAASLETVGVMATQIFTEFHPDVAIQFVEGYASIVIAMFFALVMHFLPHSWSVRTSDVYVALPAFVQAVILSVVIFIVIQTRQTDLVPFIYLQY